MTDLTLIDARGRAAGAALRAAAQHRATAPVTSDDHVRTPSPGLRPWRLAVAVAALIAVVGTLVVLARRDTEPARPVGPEDLRYVIDDLPREYTVVGARDGDRPSGNDLPGYEGTLFGTPGDPTAPTVLLQWVDQDSPAVGGAQRGFAGLIGTADQETFDTPVGLAGCGDRATGETTCQVRTDVGYVATTSLGVPRADLRRLLTTLEYDANGARVASSALPSSLSEVRTGPLWSLTRFSDVFDPAAAAVRWNHSDGGTMNVTVLHDDGALLARFGIHPGWAPEVVDGVAGFMRYEGGSDATITWATDGKVFTVEVVTGSSTLGNADELARSAAEHVRRASSDEWAALPRWDDAAMGTGVGGTDTTIAEVPVETTAVTMPVTDPGTLPPGSPDIVVALDRLDQFGGEVAVRATGPRVAPDQVTIGLAVDTFRMRTLEGTVVRPLATEPTVDLVPLGEARGAYVLSPVDGELVVTGQDGTRYRMASTTVFDSSDTRFAMIILPVNIARAELVDADGTVLASMDIPTGP